MFFDVQICFKLKLNKVPFFRLLVPPSDITKISTFSTKTKPSHSKQWRSFQNQIQIHVLTNQRIFRLSFEWTTHLSKRKQIELKLVGSFDRRSSIFVITWIRFGQHKCLLLCLWLSFSIWLFLIHMCSCILLLVYTMEWIRNKKRIKAVPANQIENNNSHKSNFLHEFLPMKA